MFTAVHAPSAPLSAFVANLWALSDSPAHLRERIIPSGTLELVINLADDEFRIYDSLAGEGCRRFSGAIVSGAYDKFFVIDPAQHASVIGVHFKPGGAAPFLGLPPGELAGSHVDLESLWGSRARELRDLLCTAPTARRRFEMLEAWLLERLNGAFSRHAAVGVALSQLQSGATVRDVVAQVGVSHRRFIEIFSADVGMTPKLFARVQRFQRASALAQRQASPNWSEIASGCGYFDQSHLIRDFQDFSGLAPRDFLRHSTPRLKENHLALLDGDGSNSSNTQVRSEPTLFTRKRRHGRIPKPL